MKRPPQVSRALVVTMILAVVTIATRALLLLTFGREAWQTRDGFVIQSVLAGEALVLGVLLFVVAIAAHAPKAAVHRFLKTLYIIGLVDASLWLCGSLLLIAIAANPGPDVGHGGGGGIIVALMLIVSIPRAVWVTVKIVVLALLLRAMSLNVPPWLASSSRG